MQPVIYFLPIDPKMDKMLAFLSGANAYIPAAAPEFPYLS